MSRSAAIYEYWGLRRAQKRLISFRGPPPLWRIRRVHCARKSAPPQRRGHSRRPATAAEVPCGPRGTGIRVKKNELAPFVNPSAAQLSHRNGGGELLADASAAFPEAVPAPRLGGRHGGAAANRTRQGCRLASRRHAWFGCTKLRDAVYTARAETARCCDSLKVHLFVLCGAGPSAFVAPDSASNAAFEQGQFTSKDGAVIAKIGKYKALTKELSKRLVRLLARGLYSTSRAEL